jgi:hypothetical protein
MFFVYPNEARKKKNRVKKCQEESEQEIKQKEIWGIYETLMPRKESCSPSKESEFSKRKYWLKNKYKSTPDQFIRRTSKMIVK